MKEKFCRILVAIDGSESSKTALEYIVHMRYKKYYRLELDPVIISFAISK
jgi:hypothetical protein